MALTPSPDPSKPIFSARRSIVLGGAMLVGLCALGLLAVTLRLQVDAGRAMERAELALTRDDAGGAILALGEAIRANPWPASARDRASLRLADLARELEGANPAQARAAWRELRSAWLGSRAALGGGDQWLERAEAGLARSGAGAEAEVPPPSLPVALFGGASAFAMMAWVGATIGFFSFGLEAQGELRPRAARRWLGVATAFFGLWIACLVLA